MIDGYDVALRSDVYNFENLYSEANCLSVNYCIFVLVCMLQPTGKLYKMNNIMSWPVAQNIIIERRQASITIS